MTDLFVGTYPSIQMSHLDDIRDTLTHARTCYEAWWLFTGEHREREKIVEAYNHYANFFSTVHPALFVTFVVKLASLFGTRNDEISLELIPDSKKGTSFQNLWDRGRHFYKYRNKLIAHRDINVGSRNYAQESGLTYNDLKALLDDTCAFFDAAARRLGVDPTDSLSCEIDLLRLIRDLKITRTSNKATSANGAERRG